MARLSAATLEVSEEEQEELNTIIRKRTNAQQQAARARIILLARDGLAVHENMRYLRIARPTVQIWRRRWREGGQEGMAVAERLSDLPRSGAPPTCTPEQVCSILATACERPQDSERPITHWTQQELAHEAVNR